MLCLYLFVISSLNLNICPWSFTQLCIPIIIVHQHLPHVEDSIVIEVGGGQVLLKIETCRVHSVFAVGQITFGKLSSPLPAGPFWSPFCCITLLVVLMLLVLLSKLLFGF